MQNDKFNVKKIVVAHFAQQHSFETAYAIYNMGCLDKYFTTLYNKPGSFTNKITGLVNKSDIEKIKSKYEERIPNNYVKQYYEILALFLKFLNRIPSLNKIRNITREVLVYLFNKKVARYVVKNNIDIFISYDTYCSYAFEYIKKRSPNTKLILDMSAPYIEYEYRILDNIQKEHNLIDIEKEINDSLFKNCLARGIKEKELADSFFVASNYSKNSLMKYGVPLEKIYLCRYGLHDNYTYKKNAASYNPNKIVCLFVGNVTSKKGIQTFVSISNTLGKEGFIFKAIGGVDKESEFYKHSQQNIDYMGIKSHRDTCMEMSKADILIFPTLFDGYGFVVTEALSMGIPVICSSNAGASDLIKNYVNGFVISPYGEKEAISYLRWIKMDTNHYKTLSKGALDSIKDISWNDYYSQVKSAINECLK